MNIPMSQNQIAIVIHCVLIALQAVPLWTHWTPDQRVGYAQTLGAIQLILGVGQKNMDPTTGNFPTSNKQ